MFTRLKSRTPEDKSIDYKLMDKLNALGEHQGALAAEKQFLHMAFVNYSGAPASVRFKFLRKM